MRLTKFADYSFRVLLHAASLDQNCLTTIEESAGIFGVSRAHLKKVVLCLTQSGFLIGQRGRSGGFRLARPPAQINLGDVIRATEPDFDMVECFQTGNACRLTAGCCLPAIVTRATQNYLSAFDACTLADLVLETHFFKGPRESTYPTRPSFLNIDDA
jgi:Rrf2 family transcriptional regulator, nitric oxide-sensitive transcriptional repressor